MKVTIKTLQQQMFTVDIQATETIKVLKQKIEVLKGKDAYPVDGQKLIYAGKMLDDGAKTLEDYRIEEKNFVVAMVSKVKPPALDAPPKDSRATPLATQPPTEAAPQQMETEEPKATDEPASTTAATPASQSSATISATTVSLSSPALQADSRYEENANYLVAMGFERENALAALRASDNNLVRTIDYLLNGVPPDCQPISQPVDGEESVATSSASTSQTPSGDESPFEYLQNQPQFRQLCLMLRNNPSHLPGFLQEIRASNPQLLEQISRNQGAFIDLINAMSGEETEQGWGGGSNPAGGAAGGMAPPPPGTQYIQISEEDKAAVDRLKALGFTETDVVQVYMACNKNETLAANVLLEDSDRD